MRIFCCTDRVVITYSIKYQSEAQTKTVPITLHNLNPCELSNNISVNEQGNGIDKEKKRIFYVVLHVSAPTN